VCRGSKEGFCLCAEVQSGGTGYCDYFVLLSVTFFFFSFVEDGFKSLPFLILDAVY